MPRLFQPAANVPGLGVRFNEEEMNIEKIVICVSLDTPHTLEAQRSKCDFCGKGVWCQPWNVKEKKACISCVCEVKDPIFGIKKEDFLRAKQEIEKIERMKR